MSRYVKRCAGECRRVLGISSFVVIAAGQRDDVCRWCRTRDFAEKDAEIRRLTMHIRTLRSRMQTLRQKRSALIKARGKYPVQRELRRCAS